MEKRKAADLFEPAYRLGLVVDDLHFDADAVRLLLHMCESTFTYCTVHTMNESAL